MTAASTCLNPLFIGEVSSTGGLVLRYPLSRHVSIPSSSGRSLQPRGFNRDDDGGFQSQSPLHRGGLFNTALPCPHSGASLCLNPLFIGEVSSTHLIHRDCVRNLEVSTPSSSGRSLKKERAKCSYDCNSS